MRKLNISGYSDKGNVRDSNQDAFLFGQFDDGNAWIVVCDGMGGANGGNVASSLAVDYVSASLKTGYRKNMSEQSVKHLLDSAVANANIRVFDKSHEDSGLFGMGTTVVAALITGETAYFSHAGDSRAYILTGDCLKRVTTDHSIVQTLIESGKLSPSEARFHPRKNVITRALGVEESVDADFTVCDINGAEKVLICTDGLTNFVDEDVIADILRNGDSAKALVEEANKNGGGDNITAVVVDFE